MKYSIITALTAVSAQAYSAYLEDCQKFAALFDATCGGTVSNEKTDYKFKDANWATTASGKSITCTPDKLKSKTMNCPDGPKEANECTVTRKNCVTCSIDNAKTVWIHVQSNGLPNHCYGSTKNQDHPKAHQMDFTVKWNENMLNKTWRYSESDVNSSDKLTALLCNVATTAPSSIPADRSYKANANFKDAAELDGVVALAMDNSFIWRPVDNLGGKVRDGLLVVPGYDPRPTTDMCLHQINGTKVLSTRSYGTCMKPSSYTSIVDSPFMTDSVDATKQETHLAKWARNTSFPSSAKAEPMGIARDGHIIVGPYNSKGELYSCEDLDICNGTFLDDNSYAYVMTATFPYVVGCWGGRAWHITHKLNDSCSQNVCTKSAIERYGMAALAIVGASVALLSF